MPRTVSLPQQISPMTPVAVPLEMLRAWQIRMVSPSVANSHGYEDVEASGEVSFELQIGPSLIDMLVYKGPPLLSRVEAQSFLTSALIIHVT
jgi:hypothetical protein